MINSTIRVLYDGQGFVESIGGVSRYFTEVMKHLPADVQWQLPLVSTSNVYLREPPFSLPPHRQSINDFIRTWCHGYYFPGVSHVYRACACLMPKIFPSGEWANQKSVCAALRKGDFDVYHLTGPHLVRDDWKLVVGKMPIVVTVHDLIPELCGSNNRVARCRAKLLSAASHIIAVSESTKRDVMRLYQVPESKISVVYHGYLSEALMRSKSQQQSPSSSDPYLLYVGKRSGYKNFVWFIRAVAPLLKNDLRLVCTGSPFSADEQSLLNELEITDRVTQRFFSDDELADAYATALAFVYPSRYEGFGIPILDAFAAGCPAILPRASCFPEVAADAALYYNPDDADGLRSQISQLMKPNASQLRIELRERGLQRVSEFSWQKCAEQTADIYRKVCSASAIIPKAIPSIALAAAVQHR